MALTVDFTGGATLQSGCTAPSTHVHDIGTGPRYPFPRLWIAKSRLDIGLVSGTLTSTDVYRMIAVPAYTFCMAAWFKVIEAEATATTATIALGDGDATAGYLTAVVPSTTVGTIHASLYNGSEAYSVKAGRFYPAADTIDVLVGTAAFTSGNGVYDVYALLMDYSAE